MSEEDVHIWASWLECLTVELEENLSLILDSFSGLTLGGSLGSIGFDDTWEDEGLVVAILSDFLQFLEVLLAEP